MVLLVAAAGLTGHLAAQTGGQIRTVLQAVPDADLSGLEPAVREQLVSARQIMNDVLANETATVSELAESFGSLGRLYYAYDLLLPARVCFQNALTLAGSDFRWNYLLGHLAQRQGDVGAASLFYQRALSLEPDDVPSAVHLAEVRLDQGEEEAAIRLYERALEQDSSCGAAHFGLGQIALSQRNFEAAVEYFQRALRLVPAANQIHYPLALAYRGLKRMEEAKRHLELRGEVGVRVADPLIDGLSELKTGEVVFLLMGRRAFNAGDYVAAAEYFGRAVEAAPRSFRALTNLGTALASLGDEEGAIRRFREAIEAGSEDISVFFNLAVLLGRRGENEEAIARLEFILDREPGDQPARLELARALQAQGRPELALEQVRKAVELKPQDTLARVREATLLLELGRFKAALDGLTESLQLFPQDGLVAHALARVLAACPDRSLRDGEKALRLALAVFEARSTLLYGETVGLAYAELGQCALAVQWQQQLVEKAEAENAPDWVARLQAGLDRYSQEPCRP